MTNKNRRVRFQKKKGRPVLDRDEMAYWLDFLPKTLKIGTEFEINLPSPERMLKVGNEQPCVNHAFGCSSDCSNLDSCLTDRHPTFCKTRDTGEFLNKKFSCPAKTDDDAAACRNCAGWSLYCRGRNCSMHTPFCTVCPSFRREGDVIESADIRMDAEAVREEMRGLLRPSEFVGRVGESGALLVTKDDSLDHNNGGIEVPTVGRRVHWQSFYEMCRGIIDPIVLRGGSVNERCGQHFHVLTGYFDEGSVGKHINELERPLPEIVLANLHQLHRRYELAMFWIMSAGASMESLTRWSRFRQSIGRFSSLQSRMHRVKEEMGEHIIGMNAASAMKGKYGSVAYHFCKFDKEGQVTTFHIENRIADGALSPTVVSAWAMLCYSLVLKAVRLSQYGIMEAGDKGYMSKIKEVRGHLIDGEMREWGAHRTADTSNLGPHIPWLQKNAKELVDWLKPELSVLGPSYQILSALADRPCSVRLSSGDSWGDIEENLYGPHKRETDFDTNMNVQGLMEVIDLACIMDCEDLDVWLEEVAAYLGEPPPVVASTVQDMLQSGKLRWSAPIGALITA